MSQSRTTSIAEVIVNVTAGYGLAVVVQLVVFPVYGLQVTLAENLRIGLIFTVASLLRSYAIRRTFERWRTAGPTTAAAEGGRS